MHPEPFRIFYRIKNKPCRVYFLSGKIS